MKIKVGIAGFGIVGKRRKVCVESNPSAEVVAVCDRKFLKKNSNKTECAHFFNWQELLDQKLDAIFVCLTNDLNAEVTIAALKKGIHVFCEKPPGRNLHEVASVMDAEKKSSGCLLMYGFNHRYHSSVLDALKIVQSGDLGRIIHLRGVYGKSKLITFDQTDWRTKRNIAGGGVLLDQGIHMIDLIRLFVGEIVDVMSIVDNSHWGFDVEDNAYALMRSKEGAVALLHSTATQWRHRFHLDINLAKGSLILGGLLTGTKSYGDETLTVIRVDHDFDRGAPKEQTYRYEEDNSWELEVATFLKCIKNNKKPEHGSSLDAFRTMELVQKIYYNDPRWRKKYQIKNPESVKP